MLNRTFQKAKYCVDRRNTRTFDPMSFPSLQTPRLRLRELGAGDAPALFDLYADRVHMQWYGIDPFPDLAAAAQGHGYMHEALGAVIPWGFNAMALNRIEAQVHPDNCRSIAVLIRLGFSEEGRLRQAAYWADAYHDLLQFSLLRAEWELIERPPR
jgi:RimJ/RimL family protein N-acetyltransferase